MVAVNLPLAHVKGVSNEIVRLWAVLSGLDDVHVVSEAASLKLIIIFREIDFDGVFGFWGFRVLG